MSERIKLSVHTIPVPFGWSPEQAWEAISRGNEITAEDVSWANVMVRDGVLVSWCDGPSPEDAL